VGLAAAGTIFSSSFANRLPQNLADAGVPQSLIPQLSKLSGALQNVGNGRALLEHLLPAPAQMRFLVVTLVAVILVKISSFFVPSMVEKPGIKSQAVLPSLNFLSQAMMHMGRNLHLLQTRE